MNDENCLNLGLYEMSKKMEIIQIIMICLGVFLIPMIIPKILGTLFGATSFIATNSQYVVGTLVNVLLILSAVNVKGWKYIVAVITVPSISAICNGYIFATASIYTVYMIPAIWLGNFALVYLYKLLFMQKKVNYIISSIIAIIVKVAIIFLGFNILVWGNIIPNGSKVFQALQIAMGSNQLITAICGAVLSFGIIGIMKYSNNKKKEA